MDIGCMAYNVRSEKYTAGEMLLKETSLVAGMPRCHI